MENPLVSVIIPIYKESLNHAKIAIDSILTQSYYNLEVIIVFDDPEDTPLKKSLHLAFCTESRVIFIYNEKNLGLANSLNKAIKLCSGKYVARMDGDDVSLNNRIQEQVLFMEKNSDIALSGTYAHVIDECGEKINEYEKPLTHKNIAKYAKCASPVLHPSWIVKISLFKNVGYYDDISPAQDYAFILKAINRGFKIANIPIYGIEYRVQKGSLSHKNSCKTIFTTNILRDIASLKLDHERGIQLIKDFNYSKGKIKRINHILNLRSNLISGMKKTKKILIPFYILMFFMISLFSKDVLRDSIQLIKTKL